MRGLERLFAVIEEAAGAETALCAPRSWDAAAFAAELRRIAADSTLPPTPVPGGIRCLGPSEIRGLRFRLVFLVGLAEGEFPKPLAESWLLPEEKRLHLQAPGHALELRPSLAAREWQLLANVLAAATDTLYLCWSVTDSQGEARTPSPFLTHLRECLAPLPREELRASELLPRTLGESWDGSSVRARLLADLLWQEVPGDRIPPILAVYGDYRSAVAGLIHRAGFGDAGPADGDGATGLLDTVDIRADLARRFGEERVLSVSALEDYAVCPFVFFGRRILLLESPEKPEEDLDLLDLGQAYHAALESFFRRCGSVPLVRDDFPLYEREMVRAVEHAFTPFQRQSRSSVARRLTAMARALCLSRLLSLLRSELMGAIDTRRTLHCELGFGLPERGRLDPASVQEPLVLEADGAKVRICGKIDRVDILADRHYAVYDYKRGRVPAPGDLLAGRTLQIPIYLLAARALFFPSLSPAGGGYYSLRDFSRRVGLWQADLAGLTGIPTRAAGSLSAQEWEQALDSLAGRILEVVRGIRAGDFRPTGEDCPSYCESAAGLPQGGRLMAGAVAELLGLNTEQTRAVADCDHDVLVSAGAGTGKTRVLVARYLTLLLERGYRPAQVAAITFTNKAAAEMRERIRQGLGTLAGSFPAATELIPELNWAPIQTIHSFCGQLLRRDPLAAGVEPGFGVLEEGEAGLMLEEACAGALAAALSTDPEPDGLREIIVAYGRQRLLRLMAQTHQAFRQWGLSPAARGVMAENDALDLDEAQRALLDWWDELLSRAVPGDLAPGTRAAVAEIRLLSREFREAVPRIAAGQEDPVLGEVGGLLGNLRAGEFKNFAAAGREVLTAFAEALTAARAALVRPIFLSLAEAAAAEYDGAKRRRAVLDFADLEIKARDLLAERERYARSRSATPSCWWTSFRTPIRCNGRFSKRCAGGRTVAACLRWGTSSNRSTGFAVPTYA